ncbi:myxalamid-type polyketide synthase MxaE and MxaD [Streptosporangium becharense]|uniref:Myxalamid-type polyketide synthase MxaE and MxaD n=1 Tax=Streptosporangium becharense TaxID=1816182 RepID=A0A7W9MF29_9ACTN|nr:type I polyketide synthase [Streptosporangium becharense]MBB2915047.1 myxalamid-type polyketide synthase MxaE and MxaD [Streptosporangium becharense]MBB5818096.1 myxalamid-type polyketide synthase MxaE and MxaD [Streptosporangium becharense]
MTSPHEKPSTREPIAVIGMACRLPGADSPEELWDLLCRGANVISEIPADRFPVDEFYHPVPGTPGKLSSRYGGFLSGIDEFDAGFFGISPREAARMDPQHRLSMEVAWEAFEDAGLTLEQMPGMTGAVFMGVITSDYWDLQSGAVRELDVHTVGGSTRGGNAGRISYALNLTGLSVALDAACSSSLVAIDLAVQSLRAGSCDIAFAGGVNAILTPDHAVGFSQGSMMAPDGQCKAFDARADGYVRSEGAGVVVLKTLTRALADGDRVHALIRGVAASNDGHGESFMAPQVPGQRGGLEAAYRNAGVDPATVAYVEAHGTGTSAGDPVEIAALDAILGRGRPEGRPLLVGSVKTNLGHTEGAAGVTGLIKTVLCLKHGWLPASLNFATPSPAIPWDRIGVRVCDRGQAWPRQEGPRRAGVSSFGIAGTNVHVVLEEAPPPSGDDEDDEGGVVLLPLSARSPKALTALAGRYRDLLGSGGTSLAGVGAAAGVRRSHHDLRLAVVADTRRDAVARLDSFVADGDGDGVHVGETDAEAGGRHRTAWVFPGQGAQWAGMGRDLLAAEPVFAEAIAECDRAMRPYADWSLREVLSTDAGSARLSEIDVVQPTIFAVQVALARLWRSWGFEPDAVVGHSMGEVAAAHVAGVLDLDDAARIICGRSRLVRGTGGRGAMAAVELSAREAEALVAPYGGKVVVAVSNAPTSTVIAGDAGTVDTILRDLEGRGVFGRRVQVDFASHSPQMDPLRGPLLELMAPLRPRPGTVPVFSTVTARFLRGPEMDAAYWVDNLREPVLFADAVQRLAGEGFDTFVEFSPNPLLARAVQRNLRHAGADGTVVTVLARDVPGRTALLEAVAELFVTGRRVDFGLIQPYDRHDVRLPSYPWQHERYWKTPGKTGAKRGATGSGHPIMGEALRLAPGDRFVWDFDLDLDRLPYLAEHRVHGMPVLPGAAYHELALAAGTEAYPDRPFEVENLCLRHALFLTSETVQRVQVCLDAAGDDGSRRWTAFTADATGGEDAGWAEIATASLRPCPPHDDAIDVPDPAAYREPVDVAEHYAASRRRGIEQSGPFQAVAALHREDGAVLAELAVHSDIVAGLGRYLLHPALLDSALQPLMTLLDVTGVDQDTYLPVRTGRLRLYGRPEAGKRLWSHAVRTSPPQEKDLVEGDVLITDDGGRLIAAITGFQLRRLSSEPPEVVEHRTRRLLYGVEWTELEPPAPSRPDAARWLVVTDSPLGPELCAQLTENGGRALLVQSGSGYHRAGPDHCLLDPASEDDWKKLVKEQSAAGTWPPEGVVHLPAASDAGTRTLEGCFHVLNLVKALTAGDPNPPRLWLVTTAAQAPLGSGDVDPEQTAVWGLGRVIPYEHPELRCSMIDLPARPGPAALAALRAEITAGGTETEIALRDGRRYASRLRRQRLPSERPVPVRSDATYLIAGGLGGVGLLTAEWLIGHGARHLVLVGRRGATPKAEERIRAMTAGDVEVLVAGADITSRPQLAGLLDEIARRMPPLRGVVNSAVVLDDGTLAQLDRTRFFAPMPPKVDGSWHLHELTRHLPLDFFLLYSSAASLIGSPGQGNYSAANAYQDGLARHRRANGLPALTVNWGQWAGTGQVAKAGRDLRLDERGFAAFAPADAFTALRRLLGDPPAQAGIMSFTPAVWTRFFPALRSSSLFRELAGEDTGEGGGQRTAEPELTRDMLAGTDEETARRLVATYLCSQVAAVVHLPREKVDPSQRLHRLGIDSLMAVQLRNRIAADLEINLPVAVFLQRRTVGDLAALALQHGGDSS